MTLLTAIIMFKQFLEVNFLWFDIFRDIYAYIEKCQKQIIKKNYSHRNRYFSMIIITLFLFNFSMYVKNYKNN